MTHVVFYDQNTMLLRLDALKDMAAGGDFVNDATVTAQIKDNAGADVGSPVTLAYVAASDGIYEGAVPHDVGVTIGGTYTVEITATQGGRQAFFKPRLLVHRRTTD